MYDHGARQAPCVYKEPGVKQPVHSSDSQRQEQSKASAREDIAATQSEFSAVQKQVLQCLGKSSEALTTRQLEAAISCSDEELRRALEQLVGNGLVSRLNTIIPSYSNRYPGVRVYGE
jgi:hypothetical protein